MRAVFADSFYYFALVNASDPAHGKATAFTASYSWSCKNVGSPKP